MRFFLVILLTFTQLAGPWLCCCGVRQVTDAVQAAILIPTPVEAEDCCKLCESHEHKPVENAPPKAPVPHTPDRCPCGGLPVAAVTILKPELPTIDGLLITVATDPPQMVLLESVSPTALRGLRELPHLTTDERLFAHHVLRC